MEDVGEPVGYLLGASRADSDVDVFGSGGSQLGGVAGWEQDSSGEVGGGLMVSEDPEDYIGCVVDEHGDVSIDGWETEAAGGGGPEDHHRIGLDVVEGVEEASLGDVTAEDFDCLVGGDDRFQLRRVGLGWVEHRGAGDLDRTVVDGGDGGGGDYPVETVELALHRPGDCGLVPFSFGQGCGGDQGGGKGVELAEEPLGGSSGETHDGN